MALDEELISKEKQATKLNIFKIVFNSIFIIVSIVVWFINLIWVSRIKNIYKVMTLGEIMTLANRALIISIILAFLLGIGLLKPFRINNKLVIFGVAALICSFYFIFGPISEIIREYLRNQ